MNDSGDTTIGRNLLARFWPESGSLTDLDSSRKWMFGASSPSLLFDAWTLPPSFQWKPPVELATVSPHEISVKTSISPVVSIFEYRKPLYLTFSSVGAHAPLNEAAWPSRIFSRPKSDWTLSQSNSATVRTQDTVSDAMLENIVLSARGIRFEDGVENDFSRRLVDFVSAYEDRAVASLNKIILKSKIPPDVASEALTWLGRIKQPSTYEARLKVLTEALLSPSPMVRDGASLGLALLGDRAAIPWTRLAVQAERNKELREDMAKVLSQLESLR